MVQPVTAQLREGVRNAGPFRVLTTHPFYWSALALLLGVAFAAYAPGLSGGFQFDDFPNLEKLGANGPITDLRSAVDLILTGGGGPTGRPLAFASFLLDATSWPAAPYPFKLHNLLFHLTTGLFLAGLCLLLARVIWRDESIARATSLLAAALWLLNPFLVSTVLFAVQRMAILAAMFSVAGLWLYTHGRIRLADGNLRSGLLQMAVAIGVFTPLAALSKENGALLPLLCLVLEYTVLSRLPAPDRQRLWKFPLLYLPVAAIGGYFLSHWHHFVSGYGRRDFTLSERLLTEPRIIIDYLYHLLVPRLQTGGLYHDNFPISTGLLAPPTTMIAIVLIIALAAFAIAGRKKFAAASAALLFFFAGHLVESTVIPLELYFEHRNYLPAMLLFFPLAGLLASRLRGKQLVLTGMGLAAVFAAFTFGRASLWADTDQMSLVWAAQNPSSVRANQQAANVWAKRGNYIKAADTLNKVISYHPQKPILRLHRLAIECGSPAPASPVVLEYAKESIAKAVLTSSYVRSLSYTVDQRLAGRCLSITTAQLIDIVTAALGARGPGSLRQALGYSLARMYLRMGHSDTALAAFRKAFAMHPGFAAGMQITATLATSGYYDAALQMLQRTETNLLRHSSVAQALTGNLDARRQEIIRIRRQIEHDMRQHAAPAEAHEITKNQHHHPSQERGSTAPAPAAGDPR